MVHGQLEPSENETWLLSDTKLKKKFNSKVFVELDVNKNKHALKNC